jgi:hypothetical protein
MFLMLITVLTVTYVRKRYKGNAFLFVLDTNDYEERPQNYVARELLTFVRNKYVFPMYIRIAYIHTPNFELS